MEPYLLGLAGGSGSGKSTLALGLRDARPGKVTVIHLDDYFRKERAPRMHGMINWDHPQTIDDTLLVHDVAELKDGRGVTIMSKDQFTQGSGSEADQRHPIEFQPAPLIIVEGFLALWFDQLRALYDRSFYLDLPYEQHLARRTHFKDDQYLTKVLKPMHEQYVAPSATHASERLNVSSMDSQAVLQYILSSLPA